MTQVATRIPAHRPVASARAAPASLFAVVLALVLALLLASCGGGGVIIAPATRPLPADFATRKAVAYSPFRTAASPDELAGEVITPAMIKQDLDLLVAAGFGLIRTYDSSDKVAKQTLRKHTSAMKYLRIFRGMRMDD